jgi:FxsC-like protein
MSRRVFISYASDNRRHDSDRTLFDAFIEDLENEVAMHLAAAEGELMFVANRDIQAGNEWTDSLAEALCTAEVMLCFGSMHYFNSTWCGREFEVFRQRHGGWSEDNPGKTARMIIPVPWIPVPSQPEAFSAFQDSDASFPREYRELGLRKLLELDRRAERVQVLTALGGLIRDALVASSLKPWPRAKLPALADAPSAFHASAKVARAAAAAATVFEDSSACFVFAAGRRHDVEKVRRADASAWSTQDGWGWRPYHPHSTDKVGELAQRAASDRKMRFVQFDCDAELVDRLRKAKKANTPVVIFADPWTLHLETYRQLMKDYDDLNLLNCALLMPWNHLDHETARSAGNLRANVRATCGQKMKQNYPSHYWEIESNEELITRALSVLDEITIRIVDSADNDGLRRAESAELSASALQQGIRVDAQPHLQAMAKPGEPA